MNRIIFMFILSLAVLQAMELRLVESFYDNRMPKKVYTYKETSDKLSLKVSTSYYKKNPSYIPGIFRIFENEIIYYSIRMYPAFGCQVNIFASPKNLHLDITNS